MEDRLGYAPVSPEPDVELALGPSYGSNVSVHGYTSELDIGLGRDGRVAKAILQSIRPSSIGSFTVGPPGKS